MSPCRRPPSAAKRPTGDPRGPRRSGPASVSGRQHERARAFRTCRLAGFYWLPATSRALGCSGPAISGPVGALLWAARRCRQREAGGSWANPVGRVGVFGRLVAPATGIGSGGGGGNGGGGGGGAGNEARTGARAGSQSFVATKHGHFKSAICEQRRQLSYLKAGNCVPKERFKPARSNGAPRSIPLVSRLETDRAGRSSSPAGVAAAAAAATQDQTKPN